MTLIDWFNINCVSPKDREMITEILELARLDRKYKIVKVWEDSSATGHERYLKSILVRPDGVMFCGIVFGERYPWNNEKLSEKYREFLGYDGDVQIMFDTTTWRELDKSWESDYGYMRYEQIPEKMHEAIVIKRPMKLYRAEAMNGEIYEAVAKTRTRFVDMLRGNGLLEPGMRITLRGKEGSERYTKFKESFKRIHATL